MDIEKKHIKLASKILKGTPYENQKKIIEEIFNEKTTEKEKDIILRLIIIDSGYSTNLGKRLFDTVLVYKLDRIGRSLSHLIKLFEEFKKRNINFISITQSINTTTPRGKNVSTYVNGPGRV